MADGQVPTNFIGALAVNGAIIVPGGGALPVATEYFYVCSVNGSNGNLGSADSPYATIDYAIGQCTANKGDTIVVMPGHAETITAAGGIACDVAGVNIIGVGTGTDRPELTFSTATSASVLITAANVLIANIVGISGIDALTNPFHVQAAGCSIGSTKYGPIEWQDPSSSLQAVRTVLTTAAGDNLNVYLKTVGITSGGTAPVNAVRLVGCNTGKIVLDHYGRASTAVVEFLTTACSNIEVYGYMYNSGTTDGSKDIIDTVTGSTWFGYVMDGSAGATYSGGSAAAWASDDVSAVNSKLGTITNTGGTATLGAVLGDFATDTLIGVLAGSAGIVSFPAAAAAANAVSLAEVIRYISEYQVSRVAVKTIAAAGTSFTTGLSPVTLFTVTGNVKARVYAVATTALASTLNNGTLAIGVSGNTGGLIAATTADGTNFATNTVWAGDTSPTLLGEVFSNTALNWALIGNSTNIIATIATNSMTAGAITFYCEYIPLNSSSTVVAA